MTKSSVYIRWETRGAIRDTLTPLILPSCSALARILKNKSAKKVKNAEERGSPRRIPHELVKKLWGEPFTNIEKWAEDTILNKICRKHYQNHALREYSIKWPILSYHKPLSWRPLPPYNLPHLSLIWSRSWSRDLWWHCPEWPYEV